MRVLVSACLLGRNCKYSGGNNRNEKVLAFLQGKEVVPVCPEVEAGLPVPRPPVEIRKGRVVRKDGRDMDEIYRLGAARVLSRMGKVDLAILNPAVPPAASTISTTAPSAERKSKEGACWQKPWSGQECRW